MMQTLATNADIILPIILLVVAIFGLPAVYFLIQVFRHRQRTPHSLLLVSTDETARRLINNAARRIGYQTIRVYRYEDALEKLSQDMSLRMIVIDDSVPQYEAGMLLSMLRGSPI